jgi:dTDP-4-dehydrorhamnose 3,5-epimerase-like enzyme
VSLIKLIDFPSLGDDRGSLVAIEGKKSIPFDIKRVYYISTTQKGVARGFHAHKQLKQVAVCITGKCRILLDNGKIKEAVWLDSATKGVLIEDMIWREMYDFSDDCVLLVLANEHYDETDYIRSYQEFITQVNK